MAGSGKELKGSLKEGVGKLVGNEKLEAKGHAEKVQGRTRRRAGARVAPAAARPHRKGAVAGFQQNEDCS